MKVSIQAKKFIFISLLCLVALASVSSVGLADDSGGVFLTEGLMGYSLSFSNAALGAPQQRTFGSSETSLGYVFSNWLYFGGVINYTIVNQKNTDGFNNPYNHQETYQYYGPALGYIGENWFLIGHYYAAAEKRDTVTGNFPQQNYDYTGTGFGINLGYKFPIWGFEMAPVLAYKNINYTNCKDPNTGATSTCNPTQNQTETTPYITFLFAFK